MLSVHPFLFSFFPLTLCFPGMQDSSSLLQKQEQDSKACLLSHIYPSISLSLFVFFSWFSFSLFGDSFSHGNPYIWLKGPWLLCATSMHSELPSYGTLYIWYNIHMTQLIMVCPNTGRKAHIYSMLMQPSPYWVIHGMTLHVVFLP